MDRSFNPRSIVLFGASSNPPKGGYQVLQNFKQYMERHGYPDFHIAHPRDGNYRENRGSPGSRGNDASWIKHRQADQKRKVASLSTGV